MGQDRISGKIFKNAVYCGDDCTADGGLAGQSSDWHCQCSVSTIDTRGVSTGTWCANDL